MSGRLRSLSEEWHAAERMTRLAVVTVAAAAVASLLLTLFNYPVIGHDAYVHLNWLDQFTRLRALGVEYPKWLPRSNAGYGSPAFYFYPPLVYFVASWVTMVIRVPAVELYNLSAFLATALSVLTTNRAITSRAYTKLGRLIGILLYSFVAYRFLDVFVRDALSEHWALALLPLLFVRRRDAYATSLWDAVAWGLLLLTSMPVAYLAGICIVIDIATRRAWREALPRAIGLVIGVLLTSIYLVPAVMMRPMIQTEHLWDLAMNTSAYGNALIDLASGRVDLLRVLSVLTILAGLFLLVTELRREGESGDLESLRVWWWLLGISLLLQLPFTGVLWELVPGLRYVQFSWRLCGVILFALAMIGAGNRRAAIDLAVVVLALATIASAVTLGRHVLDRTVTTIDPYRRDAPEYLTHWSAKNPDETYALTERRATEPAARLLGLPHDGDTIALLTQGAERWSFVSRLAAPAEVRFHLFYWPAWTAIDSIPNGSARALNVRPDPSGIACALLPAGEHIIQLRLERTPYERTGRTLSEIGLVVLGLLGAVVAARRVLHPEARPDEAGASS